MSSYEKGKERIQALIMYVSRLSSRPVDGSIGT